MCIPPNIWSPSKSLYWTQRVASSCPNMWVVLSDTYPIRIAYSYFSQMVSVFNKSVNYACSIFWGFNSKKQTMGCKSQDSLHTLFESSNSGSFLTKETFKCHKPVKALLRSWSVGFRRFEILRISCFEISSSEVASCPVWLSSGFENVVLGLQKWRWHQCVHRTWWWVMCMNTKVSFAIKFKSIRQRSSSCWLEESVHRECWQTERNVRLALVVGTDSAVWPPSHT